MPSSPRSRATALLLSAAMLLAACRDTAGPEPRMQPPPSPGAPRVVGLMQLTLTGIGTSAVSATLTPLELSGGPSYTLAPVPGGTPPGTLQIRRVSASAVDVGTRGAGGQRYLQAIFEVRNADLNGNPYPTPRQNVTFIPVGSTATIPGTPVAGFRKQDGTAADFAIAQQLIPTGAVALDGGGGAVSQYPDVLQVFTEEEVAQVSAPPAVTNKFPYGFVVRNAASTSTRTLPANPGPEQYDGRVTFAYRLPLQPAPANDPFTIHLLVMAVEDTETRVTQSLEEQTPAGQAAFEARAASLGATTVRLLSGGSYTGSAVVERMCRVRVAGTRSNPSTWLEGAAAQWTGFTPDPYTGSGIIGRNAAISASFDRCVGEVNSGNFVVNRFQAGRPFLAGGYTGMGTTTASTPAGSFFPGEEVEVTLTTGLSAAPRVARFRAAAGAASGHFSSQFRAGVLPREVAVADVNGDGVQDLAVARRDSVGVLLGQGGGGFVRLTAYAVAAPRAIAVGNLNADAVPDLAVADSAGNRVAVLLGTGGGAFAAPVYYAVGNAPADVAIGDLNGDGMADLATANTGGENASVLLNAGSGTFGAAAHHPTGVAPSAVVIGDVDGGGVPDLAVANAGSDNVSLLLGQGGGAFTSAGALLVSTPVALKAGDLNGDGILDLVTAKALAQNVTVFLGMGGGAFAAATYPVGSNPREVALGDLNGDGAPEVVVADHGSHALTVLDNDGSGAFGTGRTYAAPGQNPVSVVVRDVSGDGRRDVVVAVNDPARGELAGGVLLNAGAGALAAPIVRTVTPQAFVLAPADVNADGLLDLTMTAGHPSRFALVRGTADGTVTDPAYTEVGTVFYHLPADLNGDGMVDLALATFDSRLQVRLGTGGGAFGPPAYYPLPITPWSLIASDMNGDGRLDLVLGYNYGTTSVGVMMNTGGGAFAYPANYLTGAGDALHQAVADVNGDGWMDVVTTNNFNSIGVFLNQGNGTLAAPVRTPLTPRPVRIVLADLNGDGRPDLAGAEATGATVMLSTGGGGFAAPVRYPVAPSRNIAAGDLNGDGVLDLVLLHESSATVLPGTGGGAFGAPRTYGMGFDPQTLTLADLTSDGRLDLVVSTWDEDRVTIWPGVPN